MEAITTKRAVPTVAEIKSAIRERLWLSATTIEVGIRQNRVDEGGDDTWNQLKWATPGSDDGCWDDDNDLLDLAPLADVLRAARKGDLEMPCELDLYIRGRDDGSTEEVLLGNETLGVTEDGVWRI